MITGILDLAADWTWELDAELRFTDIAPLSSIAEDTSGSLGFSRSRCVGQNIWDIGFKPYGAPNWSEWREAMHAHNGVRDLVLSRHGEDGIDRYISLNARPLFDCNQTFTGYAGIAREVSSHFRQYESLARFREAMDMCGDSIYLTDYNTMKFIDVNTTASEKMGYTRAELLTMGPANLLMSDKGVLQAEFDAVIAAGAEGVRTDSDARSKSDQLSMAEMHRRPLRVGDRWIIVSIARDVTRRRQAENVALQLGRMYAALSATEEAILRTKTPDELYQRVCEAAVDGGKLLTTAVMLKLPGEMKLQYVAGSGHGLETLADVDISTDENDPAGRGLVGIACRTGLPSVSNDFCADPNTAPWHVLAEKFGIAAAAAIPIKRGTETEGALILYANEKCAFDEEIIGLLERMVESMVYALDNFELEAERVRSQERIRHLATHDGLTNLPNRMLFLEMLRGAIENGKRYGRSFAVLFIDLDRFKTINDTLGHEAGDLLLKTMSSRFTDSLRASDVVARIGGDEFLVLVQETTTVKQIVATARKLLSAALQPVSINGQECRVTASIGIAQYPQHGDDDQSLMKSADMAMYLAKEEGKNNYQFFSNNIRSRSLERMVLETELRSALDLNELTLQYQPKIDSRSGLISGVEALLRWHNQTLGDVSPTQLLPVAEETGIIIPIGRWVLRTACEQNVDWAAQGLPPVCISVNVSFVQFCDCDFLSDISAILQSTGMPPALLELELTESMVIRDIEHAVPLLKAIKDMGVRLAIDDFGTGYSSLAQIRRFPIDTLKVDRSFIREVTGNSEDRSIADAIIAMGKILSVTVVAEGVETSEQEQYLRDNACDEMQGYRFSKPVGPKELAVLLKANETKGKVKPYPV